MTMTGRAGHLVCTVDGCGRSHYTTTPAGGMCHAHTVRWRKWGDPRAHIPIRERRPRPDCTADGCEAGQYSAGLCTEHYTRWMYARSRGRA